MYPKNQYNVQTTPRADLIFSSLICKSFQKSRYESSLCMNLLKTIFNA